MQIGLVLLIGIAIVIYLGIAQRVLDRMNLTDTQAFIFLGLMILGSFIDIPISRRPVMISLNVGGALIPLALVVWLIARAGTSKEKWRGLIAGIATGVVIWGFAQLMGIREPAEQWLDPIWSYSLIAGIIGYLAGRSRRSAFIAGVLGIVVSDLIHMSIALAKGMATTVAIGGAGVLDAVILAGIIAVTLAELVGESRERLQGGPEHDPDRPQALDNEEFLLHEFSEDDQSDADSAGIDINAVGIDGKVLEILQNPTEKSLGYTHTIRIEKGGNANCTSQPGKDAAEYSQSISEEEATDEE
ncbi:MAG: DUF1614 domain-containing protein [Firmicutes bacterium]|nr:DUF1614 domain-containing protein [Bacillota bacterium]